MTPLLVPHCITHILQECREPDLFGESPGWGDTKWPNKYLSDEGNHEMEPRLSPSVQHGSTSLVNTDVTGINHVESTCEVQSEYCSH